MGGRAGGRMVMWLPKYLGCIGDRIFLLMVLGCACFAHARAPLWTPIRYVTLHFRIRSISVFRAISRSYVWIEAVCGIVFLPARKAIWYIACKRCLNLGDIALLTLVALFGNSRRVTGKWLKKNFHAGWQEMNLAAKKNTRKAIDAVWSSSVSDDSGKRTAFLSDLETNRLHSR